MNARNRNARRKKQICVLLICALLFSVTQPAFAAGITYMPDVKAEMTEASYWADQSDNADEVILTPAEIKALNRDSALAEGTMIMDLKSAPEI